MELPIDHFRLLGVSPSADSQAVLRALQVRLDRPPEQGFTNEVLAQRAELLRLSADLLTDQSQRDEYETALLGGALGLEFSSNREVAGLILLWEADASNEAFGLARKALQPPQAPALGSGRESDLTLIAACSCRAAALQEQEQRHFEAAALLLQEGIQLLQRMGKLADERKNLEKELDLLLPYRILDLVSRDLSSKGSREEGLRLLDGFVRKRGGLEGRNSSQLIGGLKQSDFEIFFQQIRNFLTVQEQLDLFIHWRKRSSADAGFLSVLALAAVGFSRRKPERLEEARRQLRRLNLPEIDQMPLLGSMDLLLADVQQAEQRFFSSPDESLQDWLKNYPGETLGALCEYCRDWLRRDVLPGYRDVDAGAVDLEAWFADRDVQKYVENLERKGALGIAKSGFSFLTSLTGEEPGQGSDDESDLGFNEAESDFDVEESQLYQIEETELSEKEKDIAVHSSGSFWALSNLFGNLFAKNADSSLHAASSFFFGRKFFKSISLVVVLLVLGIVVRHQVLRPKLKTDVSTDQQPMVDDTLKESKEKALVTKAKRVEPLTVDKPSEFQIRSLIETWLDGKATILAGRKSDDLSKVARELLVTRVIKQRAKDRALGLKQKIEATITTFRVVNQTNKRIEVKVKLAYRDQRMNSSGELISETSIPNLQVTYILGREKKLWQLVAFISGS